MNNRIDELISAYLVHGLAPDEERELFEACLHDQEAADALRRQMMLSLKLRALRDRTEVPRELHNALLEKIHQAEIEMAKTSAPATRVVLPRFGWKHLTGASLVSALGAAVLFILFSGKPDFPVEPQVIVRSDTVLVTQTDTVVRIQRVRIPMNLAESVSSPAPVVPSALSPTPRVLEVTTEPALAQTLPVVEQEMRLPTASSYLDQYTTMVSSLEKTPLSPQHRVRN